VAVIAHGEADIPSSVISGNVGASGVTMNFSDGGQVVSEPDGSYEISVPNGWNGTVTPSHPCLTLRPSQRNYSNVMVNQLSQDYSSTFNSSPSCWTGNFIYAPIADFNGDEKSDASVFRMSNSTWYIQEQGPFEYGQTDDLPVLADYNGDQKPRLQYFVHQIVPGIFAEWVRLPSVSQVISPLWPTTMGTGRQIWRCYAHRTARGISATKDQLHTAQQETFPLWLITTEMEKQMLQFSARPTVPGIFMGSVRGCTELWEIFR